MFLADVMIEHPVRHLDMSFTYLSETKIQKGIRVHVPFGKQKLVGYVLAVRESELDAKTLILQDGIQYRMISDMIDEKPILTPELERLANVLAKMTFTPLISCLKTMLPPALKPSSKAKITQKKEKVVQFVQSVDHLTPKQKECLNLIETNQEVPLKKIPYSRAVIQALEKKGAVKISNQIILREVKAYLESGDPVPKLNALQKQVLTDLFSSEEDKPFLLYGVTGSGKTEVYLQATQRVVEEHKQVLMLVPEISLTPKIVSLFQKRFGSQVAILHSRLSDGQRYDEYQRILKQEVQIVVGARSAVFAPLTKIGLIILDEEHDQSYKQNNNPRYHTRDIALWRSRQHHALLLLGSASPSIESYAKAEKGIYHLLSMPTRATLQPLPSCQMIDMSQEAKRGNLGLFSQAFEEGLKRCLEAEKQALILVNRRGYATYLLCKECGYVPQCPHCDVTLTYHKRDNVLRCHYCGYEIPYQKECPECHSELLGFRGMGTEQTEEILAKQFPMAKIIRYDLDTTKNKLGHEKLLEAFEKHEGNVLLGTQMIAKGLDFKDVSFVGVLDGDGALNIPDFRSSERTFQLLLQVAGRAGRHQNGEVVIQTYNPQHYAIKNAANQDYEAFYIEELKARKAGFYPPYCYMASILFTGKHENEVAQCAQQFAAFLKGKLKNVLVLGPAPSLISRINNQYRYRILIKYKQSKELFTLLHDGLKNYQGPVKIEVDVNPYTQL